MERRRVLIRVCDPLSDRLNYLVLLGMSQFGINGDAQTMFCQERRDRHQVTDAIQIPEALLLMHWDGIINF